MKVVALVSGGKDSCYSIMQCLRHGHQVVALANLLPEDNNVDELDSYMYQTVGHQIVAAYAECMGLPLFRKRICGSARLTSLRYMKTEGDEVEDLEILLRAVREKMPEVDAVCSGAIASDYQRLRVESVCSALGLVSLAYLWQRPQGPLLEHMIRDGLRSIIVKVAAMGLEPEKHLGADLMEMQPQLKRLSKMFGINECGEGGEYETLTLDCPLFKHAHIVLDEFAIHLHSPGSIASVGVLHPSAFHLESKHAQEETMLKTSEDRRAPPPPIVIDVDHEALGIAGVAQHNREEDPIPKGLLDTVQITTTWQQNGYVAIGCRRLCSSDSGEGDGGSEVGLLLAALEGALAACGMRWEHVLYVRVLLADMAAFARANAEYAHRVTEANCPRGPPSRCALAAPLRAAGLGPAALHALAAPDAPTAKRVLHVQSVSCWAPSCIGPYSQATLHGNLLLMAGQLGLDPPTMALVSGGAAAQAARALLSCEAVAQLFKTSAVHRSVCFTVFCAAAIEQHERQEVSSEIKLFLAGRNRDIWRRKPLDDKDDELQQVPENECPEFEVQEEETGTLLCGKPAGEEDELGLPRENRLTSLVQFVVMPGLPKGALVEIAPIVFHSNPEGNGEEDSSDRDTDDEDDLATTVQGRIGEVEEHDVSVGQTIQLTENIPLSGRKEAHRMQAVYPIPLHSSRSAGKETGKAGDGLVPEGMKRRRVEWQVEVEALTVSKHFCRAHAVLLSKTTASEETSRSMVEGGEGEMGVHVSEEDLTAGLETCRDAVASCLHRAHFSWSAVMSTRLYFAVGAVPRRELEHALQKVFGAAGSVAAPLTVPVLMVGPTPEANGILAFECTAVGNRPSA